VQRWKPDACGRFEIPYHDYEVCTGDAVANPSLFEKEEGDVDEVDAKDVQQRGLGDCALMSVLAGLASSPDGRALVKSAITENKNEKGETTSYTVRVFQRDAHPPHALQARYVTVDGKFSEGHAEAQHAGNKSEIWPLVIERAYAQLRGGANAIGHGGSPKDAMEALTGQDATSTPLGVGGGRHPESQLKADLEAHKLVVLSTKWELGRDGPHGLTGSHAYQVSGYEEQDGRLFLKLHNPWNFDEPTPIPFDEVREHFDAVDVGSVR
jgi:hypothetical protein